LANPSTAETLYIAFAGSHVKIENHIETEILSDVADLFGALVASEPTGAEIGRLEFHRYNDKVLLIDPTRPTREFTTLREASNGVFHTVIQTIISDYPKLLWLHAGVVSSVDRAMVFLGPSRSGKSTLVTELIRTGWHYLSDEVAPIDPEAAVVMPFPITPLVRKPGSSAIKQSRFGAFKKEAIALDLAVVAGKPIAIGAFVVPRYRSDVKANIARSSPAAAVVTMLNNSLNINPYAAKHVGQFCALVAQIPCFNLEYANAAEAVALLRTIKLASEYA
jgi:hypothetical protein